MSIFDEYRSKLCSATEAVRRVQSGDWVDLATNVAFPVTLEAALAERQDELRGVKLRGNLLPGPLRCVECDPTMEHFVYQSWHCSGYERKLCAEGRAFFSPMTFRHLAWYYREHLTVDVAMLCAAPMDDDGYFNLSGALGVLRPIIETAKSVLVEVNPALPRIHGSGAERLHISEVDAVVETAARPVMEMPPAPANDIDRAIARQIVPYVRDGATLQLGIGGIPTAVGAYLADSDVKALGMHTELCSDGYLELYKAGKLTNARKTLHTGKGVLALAVGTRALYDWLDDNPDILGCSIEYVNDPYIIAQNDKLISINGCLNADLYGQVCSESVGTRQISGSGGQLDFVEGAIRSKGGRSFLCMSSTFTDKSGALHSRILPQLGGDIVTTPRSVACDIVTEYGVAELIGKSTWERAEALISVAHPDFRDGLIKEAEAQRIWLPSSKR